MRFLIVLPVALLLGGCPWAPKPETAVVDTYCATAKKRKWRLDDTPESIRDARVHNMVVDQRCGVKKGGEA